MRYKELLLEYNEEFTRKTFGDQLVKRYAASPDRPLNYLNYSKDTVLDEILKNLENGDPTTNKKYMPWIVRNYINGNIKRFEDLGLLRYSLEAFEKYKNSNNFIEFAKSNLPTISDVKNIFNYDVKTIRKLMADYTPEEKIVDKGNSIEFYSDETVRVIEPLNTQAACYYGQGTQWCTAATKGQNYFDHYFKQGPLYILLPKDGSGNKYQLHITTEQFANQYDEMLSLEECVTMFPKFIEYLKTHGSEKDKLLLSRFLTTASDETILKIWNVISDIVHDHMWEIVNTVEADDYGYWAELNKLAQQYDMDYVDIEELEKVTKQDLSYTEYNDDLRQFIQEVQNIRSYSVGQIKNLINTDMASEMFGYDEGWLTLEQLDDFYEIALHEESNNHDDYYHQLSEFINWKVVTSFTKLNRPGTEYKVDDVYIYALKHKIAI